MDLTIKLEDQLYKLVYTGLRNPAYGRHWEPVQVQKGVSNQAIKAPCVICFVDRSEEHLYGVGVFKVSGNLQIQTHVSEGSPVHIQRVNDLESYWQSFDTADGSYRGLAAQLTNHEQNVHVYGVIPGAATNSVNDDLFIFNRELTLMATWVEDN